MVLRAVTMAPHIRLRYLVPALVALAMIFYGVVTSSVNTRNNLRDFNRVARSRTILTALQDTMTQMLNAETSQRGFILVADENYLEHYYSGIKKADQDIATLMELTADDPDRQAEIRAIRTAIEERKKPMVAGIEARRGDGFELAVAKLREGGGKERMDTLRKLIDQAHEGESLRLEKAVDKLTKSLDRTNRTVVFAGTVAIAAGTVGTLMVLLLLSARQREGHLIIQKEKAEETAREKSDFLAMMSHEIRTPMNAILGFGELLHDAVETPKEKHYASVILSSGNSLLSLINDILDLSKIEAGKLEIQPEPVAMAKFAENLETLFSFRAAEKGLGYSICIDSSVPPLLFFDALRLRQVLVNLVGNAIKFSREGSVTVVIHAEPITAEETLNLHIDVADTGIGIPEEHTADIFRPFYQIDSRQNRQFQGTGLGLSISRRLVEAMDGVLALETVLGKGSVFRVTLPTRLTRRSEERFALEAEKLPLAVDFNYLKASKILVTDDEPLNAELIRSYLAGTHHTVLEAENAEQAASLCLQHLPDVVLMDIRMPGMDGVAALERIRACEKTKHIPLIAVSASALLDSHQEIKTKFDGFADKPISRSKLFLELSKFIPLVESPPPPVTQPTQTPAVTQEIPDPGHDWSSLCQALMTLERTTWPSLVKLVPAQGTMTFSAHLIELARAHSCPTLGSYARQLSQSAEVMDFAESSRLLKNFPQVIAELRSCHD